MTIIEKELINQLGVENKEFIKGVLFVLENKSDLDEDSRYIGLCNALLEE